MDHERILPYLVDMRVPGTPSLLGAMGDLSAPMGDQVNSPASGYWFAVSSQAIYQVNPALHIAKYTFLGLA